MVDFIWYVVVGIQFVPPGQDICQNPIIRYRSSSKTMIAKSMLGEVFAIQNRLIELWGLFDFLMPGYLYSEDVFKKNYEKLFEVNLTTFKEDELLFSDEQRKTL